MSFLYQLELTYGSVFLANNRQNTILWLKRFYAILIYYRTNHQEKLENIMQVKFYKEDLIQNLSSYYLIWYFCFLGSGFHNPNYLEKKTYITIIEYFPAMSNIISPLRYLLLTMLLAQLMDICMKQKKLEI